MFNSPLYQHQIEMAEFLKATPNGGGALFAQMGLGKTRTVIFYIHDLFFSRKIKKVLVIAPKSILKNWEYEICDSSDMTSTILTDKVTNLDAMIHIINYDRISKYLLFLQDQHYDVLILDESTYIKSRWSQRTKAVYTLSKDIKIKVLMTGTPITQSVLDIFSQYLVLDGGKTFGTSIVGFRNKYMYNVSKTFKFPIWIDRKSTLPELKEKMHSLGITPDSSKVQLPVKRKKLITISMSPEQKRVYKELFVNDISTLDTTQLSAKEILAKYVKFRQICSGFFIDDYGKVIDFSMNPKMDELLYQLTQLNGLKIVIWRNFIHEGEMLKKNIKDLIVFDQDPFAQIEKFNSTPGAIASAALSQVQFGLNIYADVAIYYGNTFSFSTREQSEARHIRLNSPNSSVLYLDLVVENSIEESIFAFQRKRKDVSEHLLRKAKEVLFGASLDDNLVLDT
jgi:SNF2 family DNA or RNA helicase